MLFVDFRDGFTKETIEEWPLKKIAVTVVNIITAAALFDIELKSDDSFHNCSVVQFDGMHTALLIFVEIETEQISLVDVVIVQILRQLLLTLCIVFITVPDFQFNDVLLSKIVNDHIRTSLITGLCLNIVVSRAVYDWSQIKQE